MTTPKSPAMVEVDRLPELPEPYTEWTAYAKRAGLLDNNGVAPVIARMNTQTAYYAYSAAWNRIFPLITEKHDELCRTERFIYEVDLPHPFDHLRHPNLL